MCRLGQRVLLHKGEWKYQQLNKTKDVNKERGHIHWDKLYIYLLVHFLNVNFHVDPLSLLTRFVCSKRNMHAIIKACMQPHIQLFWLNPFVRTIITKYEKRKRKQHCTMCLVIVFKRQLRLLLYWVKWEMGHHCDVVILAGVYSLVW